MAETNVNKYEAVLRSVPTEEKVLKQRRRVSSFKGKAAVAALAAHGLEQQAVCSVMQELLDESIIFKISTSKSNAQQCNIVLDQKFNAEHEYIFAEEKTSHYTFLLCLVFVLLTFLLVTFQMWPRKAKYLVSYVSYAFGGFIVFLGAITIVRLVLFAATCCLCPPGIWLFPNLYADMGFFESFVPLWDYSREPEARKEL
jgi:translocation protein SEC62